MRTFDRGALVALILALSACGGSSSNSASEEALQRESDLYPISLIEKVVPRGDLEEGHRQDGRPVLGECDGHVPARPDGVGEEARSGRSGSNSTAWKPETHWVSDHPAYKLKVTIDGDRGTLHFECHFVDVDTGEVAAVTAGNVDVAKIDGRWLITNFVGSTSELKI